MAGSEPPSAGLPPVLGEAPRVLVLGSLPGRKSIEMQQYYAHPRNAFWRIAGELAGFDATLPYAPRCAALMARGIALWDVLASAPRPGSLDSAIDVRAAVVNPLDNWLQAQSGIAAVALNGGKAAQLFDRFVAPQLASGRRPAILPMPSTSPAHAAMSFERKLERWRAIAPYLEASATGAGKAG